MATLLDKQFLKDFTQQSSKGNQLKWFKDNIWYKADYAGYEGLSEFVVSKLLEKSSLSSDEFISYNLEQINYNDNIFNGCRSDNFLEDGCQMITLERLFKNYYGDSLYLTLFKIPDVSKRIAFLVDKVEELTQIKDFGIYLSKLLTIDALFLNEDRHMHNLAVLETKEKHYRLCPIFDNGASLLSDTTLDYPLNQDIFNLLKRVKSKTVSESFDQQLEEVEKLYGTHLHFSYSTTDIYQLMDSIEFYSEDIKKRVTTVLLQQRRKYRYLFD